MGPIEALELARTKEIETLELYREFSKEDSVARDIFLFLMDEEQKHKALIEKKIRELTK